MDGILVSEINNHKHKYKYIYKYIDMYYYIINILYDIIKSSIKAFKYYLFWIIIHYFASQLYVQYCSPPTLYGFILSSFLTQSPHCQGLRWIIYHGGGVINNMWFVFGTWVCANIL
jgi:hypothetical protein